jgi:addiction module RelB/DinJ family antitoxin
MAAKTANVLARVEPDVKEQAEAIMAKLGVPASVVINMLYKQIIMTKSIPFSVSIPDAPKARNEMDSAAFNAMMQQGLKEAKSDSSRPAADVFSELRREIQ